MKKKNRQKNELFSYHILDARRINEIIKEKIVDVIITSPPYWNLKDYKVKNQIGSGQSYDNYLLDLKNIFLYCSKITKDSGSLWIVIDTFKKDGKIQLLPFDLVREIEEKWTLQDIIIWQKDKTLPWSRKGLMRNIFEYILFFTKKGHSNFKYNIDRIKIPSELKRWWVKYPERYNPNGKTPHRLWELPPPYKELWKIPIPTQGAWGNGWVKHACPFPPELIERILLLTTDEDDVVLDPFAGSGSVIAQAKIMKRKAIGLDINEEFRNMYQKSVYPEIKQMWEARIGELKARNLAQYNLKKTIEKLRKLKYPKDLINRSVKEGVPKEIISGINSVFVINSEDEILGAEIYFIFEDLAPTEDMISKLWITAQKAPLSQYGFKPKIQLYNKNDFIKMSSELKIPNKLHLYSNGKTHFYRRLLTFDKWLKISELDNWKLNYKNHIPPILSDLEVRETEREL